MSDASGRRDSQKSRQELLDELYLLRDVAGEREGRARMLAAQLAEKTATLAQRDAALAELSSTLALMRASRSWRLTAPLRMLSRSFSRKDERVPSAVPATPATTHNADAANPQARHSDEGGNPVTFAAGRDPESVAAPFRHDHGGAAPRLFVDISELALRHGKTGVQRVTREILRALQTAPPNGYQVLPVAAAAAIPYRAWQGVDVGNIDGGVPLEPRAGDVFLGLDHSMQAVTAHADQLAAMRSSGARCWFVCNDTLPLDHPEWFPQEQGAAFKRWFETVAGTADGVACISRATESDVRRWIATLRPDRESAPATGVFRLGNDPHSNDVAGVVSPDEQAELARLPDLPTFLMVGTLEPRKGHAQALEAFNTLWARGTDAALVIVGLPGWMTEVTQRRIRHHEELGRRLFWFMDASDGALQRLYDDSTCLLMASEGEGFGLPLVEAARHGLPILCRDIPAFHEVAGDHATFFRGQDAESLASAVRQWLDNHHDGAVPDSRGIPQVTWAESAAQLCDLVLAK